MFARLPPASWMHLAFAVAVVLSGGLALGAEENPAAALEAPTVEIIGTTPLPGIGVPVNQVPANVQAATGNEIQKQKALDLSEFMENNLGSVTLNHGQNNPFQPDVNFRGLSASPLLGTPQGLSVFMDGVRINEPFGDVVNWDLIPQNAISTINLIPGSNPVFGLNTLGAALSVNTKTGFQYPGASASVYGGSWDRKAAEVEYGAHGESVDLFLAGNFIDEVGWRDYSPSRIKTLFSKVGWEREETDFDLSLMLADNTLEGTQALPLGWLDTREQAYTWPDRNENQLAFVNARASHFLRDDRLLAGNVYYRRYKNDNFSSNVNDDCEDPSANPGLCAGGIPSLEPQAINDRSEIRTDGYGGSLQLTLLNDLGTKKNNFTIGASADLGRTDFSQSEEDADFTADRGTVGTGVFSIETDVRTTNDYYGLYLTDIYSFNEQWHLTLSGRYNWANITIEDQTGLEPALNGDHTYKRFNPAAGLNFNPTPAFSTYLAYSEGMRAPTPVELTCADPAAPCRLPNNFLADPPLEKVVSRTFEGGLRGRLSAALGWNAAVYRTDLDDDIIFISSGGAVNAGFFQNSGNTRRQGLELGIDGHIGKLGLAANYGYIDATFESALTINSPVNSSADPGTGDIQVSPGNKIPGIPEHSIKVRMEYDYSESISVGTNVMYFSSQYARGDENNQDVNGKLPGYTLVNLDGRYQLNKKLMFFGRITNLFDTEYESLGVLGENFFNGTGRTFDAGNVTDEQFRAAGAPRGVWVGVKYTLPGQPGR
ncbi:MAG: TonB-dependent receptor [Betaproteobacteria bacterium]